MTAYASWFFSSQPGSPGLMTWPASASVPVSVYAWVTDPVPGQTYQIVPRLYRGQHQGSYALYDTGTLTDPPGSVTPQTLTETPTLYTWLVPVQELSGPTSDLFFLHVLGSAENSGGTIHVGSDGADNQTGASPPLTLSPYKPPRLLRNPDSDRPTQTVVANVNGTVVLGQFAALQGDPGLAIWPSRVWRLRIWARVASGSAAITARIGRKASGGSITWLASGIAVATVTETGITLFRKDVLMPESSGSVEDVPVVELSATTGSSILVTIGVGLDHPSSLNAPMISPTGAGAPSDDDKTRVESGSPRGYLSELVQSDDGSVTLSVDATTKRLNLRTSSPLGMGTATEVSGMLTMPSGSRSRARVALSTPYLVGIDATGRRDGEEIVVLVTNATGSVTKHLLDNVSVSAPFKALYLPAYAGVPRPIEFKGPTLCRFALDLVSGAWLLASTPITYPVR